MSSLVAVPVGATGPSGSALTFVPRCPSFLQDFLCALARLEDAVRLPLVVRWLAAPLVLFCLGTRTCVCLW